MDSAELAKDYLNNGEIIPSGTAVSGRGANIYFRQTHEEWLYICPDCKVSVVCVNKNLDLDNMPVNKVPPYFREAGGINKHSELTVRSNQMRFLGWLMA